MLTPKEIYESYTLTPCEDVYNNIYSGDISNGKGTPFFIKRIVQFFKHVKHACFDQAPNVGNIADTGKHKLGLPFKFLQLFDAECFTEIQPTIRSGTSHSVRNACDIARSCFLYTNNLISRWKHRGATEYIERYGGNSLPDCLMTLGPDLVDNQTVIALRASSIGDLSCLPGDSFGVAGAPRSCVAIPESDEVQCRSCGLCPEDDPDNPCCVFSAGTADYANFCCGSPMSSYIDFSYLQSTQKDIETLNTRTTNNTNTYFVPEITNIQSVEDITKLGLSPSREQQISSVISKLKTNDVLINNRQAFIFNGGSPYFSINFSSYEMILRHVGLLERQIYGGYANFKDNSGNNFYGIIDDMFLTYFQSINNWNYQTATVVNEDPLNNNDLYRARTISVVLKATIESGKSPVTDTQYIVDSIKDLLWNGYGVLLFSNVGFPNVRDSQGLSYPDRIWYTTYTIIGYDDTKLEFDECVYVLSCPWGNWIEGGHPSWGPLPPGCFLVTESHLKCMVNYYPDREFFNCRNKLPCNPVLYDCDDPNVLKELAGCGNHGPPDKCEPYRCASQQKSMGLVIAISLTEGFDQQQLKHEQFYPINSIKEFTQEQTLFYNYEL